MIILVHLLLGALIGQKISNPILAVILAFLSHYLLDLLPHVEYSIENIEKKQWAKAVPDFIKVIIDFSTGILLIFLFSKNYPIIYICALFTVVPDGLSFLNSFTKNRILEKHSELHQQKIHFLKNKKISNFWRVFSQVSVAVICVIFFKF